MKINGKPDSALIEKPTKGQSASKTLGAEPTGKTGQESAVAKLSDQSGELSAPQAPLNAAKVEEIRQAIRDGSFKVNPEAIADKVIESARELVGSK